MSLIIELKLSKLEGNAIFEMKKFLEKGRNWEVLKKWEFWKNWKVLKIIEGSQTSLNF